MDLALASGLVLAGALAHLLVALLRARAPAEGVPDLDGYLTRWQGLHGGYDPRGNVWVRGWLRLVYDLARLPARWGVAPDALTLFAVWLALGVALTAAAGGRWPLLGAVLLVASGLVDALDGAVAALTRRASAWGYLLDSLVDRVADLAYVAALVLLGAPPWLGVAVAAGVLLHEYARARGSNAGAGDIGAVTVGERPSRVVACAIGLVAAGALPAMAAEAATVSLAVLAGLTLLGGLQLLWALHRALGSAAAPEAGDGAG